MRKRVFAMVLVAALCVSLLPTTAFADEGEYTAEATEETAETDTQTADIEIAGDDSAIFVVPEVEEETDEDSEYVAEPEEETPGESDDVEDEEAAEEEADPEEIVYKEKDGSIRVEVTAPADALPEGAELSVQRYEKNSNEYRDAAEAIGFEEDQGTDMAAVDISFLLDGEEVEPAEPVKVSIDVSDILPDDADASTLEVQHLVEKADDTVKPEVVASDSEETEGTIDAKEATAEFEVESFSTFTIEWNDGTGDSITVHVYNMNGTGIEEVLDTEYTHTGGDILISDIVEHLHSNTEYVSTYSYEYATVQYETSNSQGSFDLTTLGSEENSVVEIAKSGTTYTITFVDGNSQSVTVTNASYIFINMYYSVPTVTITAEDPTATPDVSLTTTNEYFKGLDADDAETTYTWYVPDSSRGSVEAVEGNESTAIFTWAEGLSIGDEATVTVTMTNTYTDENGTTITESASDTYTLIYGAQAVTITVYAEGTTTGQANARVALLDENGTTVVTGTTGEDGTVTLYVSEGTYTVGVTYVVATTGGAGSTTRYTVEGTVMVPESGTASTTVTLAQEATSGSASGSGNASNWDGTTPYYYEHIDVKVAVATDENTNETFSNLDSVYVFDKYGNLIYRSEDLVPNEDTTDYNCLFDLNDDEDVHSIVVSSTDTIVITYEVVDNETGETKTYTATLSGDTAYTEGEYYHIDSVNAYKLYNALYGGELESNADLAAIWNEANEHYNANGLPLDGLYYMQVADIVCDTSGEAGRAGLDFVIDVSTIDTLITGIELDLEKEYEGVPEDFTDEDLGTFTFDIIELSNSYVQTTDETWYTTEGQVVSHSDATTTDWTYSDGTWVSPIELDEDAETSFTYESESGTNFYYYIIRETTEDANPEVRYYGLMVMVDFDATANQATIWVQVYELTKVDDEGLYGTYTFDNTQSTWIDPDAETGAYPLTFVNIYETYQKDVDADGDGEYGDSGMGVKVGDTLTYKIDYPYTDDEDTTVTITDVLDEGLDFVSASDNGTYDEDTRTITWVIEDVASKEEDECYVTFTATVNETALVRNEVDNTATIQVGDDPDTAVDTNTVYNPVPDKDVDADGDGEYKDSGMQVEVGGTLVYKIDYENPDDEAATVTITDEVDAGLDFVSATDNGSYDESSRTITWVIENVEPHTNGSVYFTATVNEDALIKNEVENTAMVQVGDHDAQQTKTVYNPLRGKDVDADADGEYGDSGVGVKVGDTLTYIIYYYNEYDEEAAVTITDVLDEGLDFVEASDGGTYDESTRMITWTISGVEAHSDGSVTFTATVNENALETNEVENTAEVQINNDLAVETNTVYNPVPDKDVDANGDEVFEDSGMLVKVGDTLVYKIDYENPDDDAATVTITDEVDAGLDFVSATDDGSYDESTRTITWVIEGVEAHTNGSVYFTATVNENALVKNVVENTATVQVGEHDAQQTKTVYNPIPGKDVDADGNGEYGDTGMGVQVGDTLTYEIDYFNGYNTEATVTITDVLDEGLDFVEASDGGIYDESTRTITWVIEGVEAQTAGSVTFTATVNETALVRNEVDNTATVQVGDDPETAVETNTVYNPVPDKDVDADGDGVYEDSGMQVEVGDTLVYKIDYENPDDEAATVTITDELDIGLDYVESTDNGSYDESSRTITWVIENVEPHINGSVYFTATVNENALEKHEVDNTATVQVGNHAEQQTKTVYNPIPEKDVDADADGEYGDNGMGVQVGDTLTYEIDYFNGYDTEATVTITDELDEGLDFVSASDGGSYDEDTRTITWVIEDVAAQTAGSVTFTATVNETALVRNEVDNTATVQVGDDPDTAVDTNTVYNPVPDKDVDADGDDVFEDSGMYVEVGSTLVYKIDYENPDDDPATVTITDELDIGLDFVEATDGGSYNESERMITWVIEDVEPHTNGSVYFTATVNANALINSVVENTATVQVGEHEAQQTKTVYNPLNPEKDVDADSDGEYGDTGLGVQVGDTLTYIINYFNGNEDSATVTITDVLDEGIDFVEASDGGIYDEATRTITWVIEGVEAHKGGSVTFEAAVNETALTRNEVENRATVQIQVGDDPGISYETEPVYNPVTEKDVDIHGDDTFGDDGLLVRVGDTLTYKIYYQNPDDEAATVTITDELDVGLDFVDASDDGTYDESTRTITWVIEDVAPHSEEGYYVTFRATVNQSALQKNEVDNTATVQVGEHPAQETNKVENPLGPRKDVDIHNDDTYGDNGLAVQVGDTLTYKIVYINGNDDPATVTITDKLDEGLDFVEASDGGTYDEETRTITWVLENVEGNTHDRVTFQATVNETALIKSEVENTATVQVGDDPAQETNTVVNPVRQYYPIDEEIVTDEDDIFDLDAWVKDESVNEYNAIEIEMTTMLPLISGEDVANGEFTMNFHEVLDHELILHEGITSFSVYLRGNTDEPFEVPEEYYTVTINPEGTCTMPDGEEVQCSFHVDVDLTALYNDGLVSDEDLQGNTWISIFFFADLEGTDLNGSYTSTIWYDVYDGENWEYTSNMDVVSVYTYEIEIAKVDGETGDPLADAIFGIYYDEACENPVYRYVGQGFDESQRLAYTATSDEGGVAMFYGLAEGTYYVKELYAPMGYVLSDEIITVELGADTTDDDHVYHTTFENTPAEPNEPQNPRKYVETNGDGDFNDNGLTVNVGDDLTYRIYYYNHYDEPVTVTVKDTLDYALDFKSATNGGTYDEETRTITWTVENAAAESWGYVEFTATANDIALLENYIENTASVQIADDDFVDTNQVVNPTPEAEENGNPTSGTGSPKTGDTNNFGLWLVLMMAAMVGVLAALRMRKRS